MYGIPEGGQSGGSSLRMKKTMNEVVVSAGAQEAVGHVVIAFTRVVRNAFS